MSNIFNFIMENKIKNDISNNNNNDNNNNDNNDNNNENYNDKINYNELPWNIIESYFRNSHLRQLIRHQIESYNYFVNNQLPNTIEMFNPLHIVSEHDYIKELNLYRLEIVINFKNLSIHRPQIYENNGVTKIMFPQEARLRNFTYASAMTIDLDIEYIIINGENYTNKSILKNQLKNIHIGKLPIMLKSDICILNQYTHLNYPETGECRMDPGGYFIINGSEKTVLGQERAAENQIYCYNVSKTSKWTWQAEMKCVPRNKCISPKQINIMIYNKNNIGPCLYLQIPRLKNPIPIFTIFRIFNVISDKDICEKILLNIDTNNKNIKKMLHFLKGSIIDSNNNLTYNDSFKVILQNVIFTPINVDKDTGIKKKQEFAKEVIKNDIFPHCENDTEKIYMMGYMINILIQTSFGWIEPSDRDSYINKRIDLTGVMLNNLFRNYFNKLVKDMQKTIVREVNNGSWKSNEKYESIINTTNIYKIIKSTTIENGIKRALATGDFGIKQINNNKVGVAQVLNRLTYISSLSHLRRVNTPIDKSGKLVAPRRLHNSTWGFLCPAETPEGSAIGIVKNLSYMTHVTIPSYNTGIFEIVNPLIEKLENLDTNYIYDKIKVFINGCWIGISKDPYNLLATLKEKKYNGIINIYTSIIFDIETMVIKICNDGGRLCRPVLRVENNKLLITNKIINDLKKEKLSFNDLLTNLNIDNSVIEYIDSYEQNNSLIAMEIENLSNKINHYTHCEIHPSTIFGILASCIPFPENNQSPRNTYQSAMGKQAMGVYVTNFDNRMDKTAYVLSYPMRPLVDTRLMNIIQLNNIPSGEQVIVAIASYTGYNQEDSILFNQGSVDRGLFLATILHTEKDEDKKLYGNEEIRGKPDKQKTKNIKFANYDKVDNNGVIPKNTIVNDRDIIIAKVLPIKENKNDSTKVIKYLDESKIYRTHEETYIDKNYIGRNGDGYNFCKVRLRNIRKPVHGDKFSSRHGQKGTIGNIIPEKDMPFTENGLRPDIIINPHAIPSRMTIAQLKETILGKVLLQLGLFGDATSFCKFDVETITNELRKVGFESNGNEVLYNALTGEQLNSNIFIGPAFYQRLKHMVSDKQHSRSIGPMVNLTRQPAEGRSRDGGLRFGEMERDAMIAHGCSSFTKDRLYTSSDAYYIHVCNKCGMIAAFNNEQHIHICNTCENRSDFKYVEIPYSCKLMFQELITMNVAPRIICE